MCAHKKTETITTGNGDRVAQRCCECTEILRYYDDTVPDSVHGCLFIGPSNRLYAALDFVPPRPGQKVSAQPWHKTGGFWDDAGHATFKRWASKEDACVTDAIAASKPGLHGFKARLREKLDEPQVQPEQLALVS